VFAIKRMKKPKITFNVSGEVKKKERKVYFDDWVLTPVYIRETLPKGFKGEGPAIIEEYSSTTVIPDGWSFEVLDNYFIRISR